jgi:hypothetical protein
MNTKIATLRQCKKDAWAVHWEHDTVNSAEDGMAYSAFKAEAYSKQGEGRWDLT